MNKRFCVDIKETPLPSQKLVERKLVSPFSLEMLLLAIIVSIFLFPEMWKELKLNKQLEIPQSLNSIFR